MTCAESAVFTRKKPVPAGGAARCDEHGESSSAKSAAAHGRQTEVRARIAPQESAQEQRVES